MTLLPRILLMVLFILSTGVAALPGAQGEYQAKGRRDPLVALLTPKGQRVQPPGLDEESDTGVQHLVLQGIVFDPQGDSFSVINGKVVRANDEIDGMKILKIEPTAVTVRVEGAHHRLTLSQPQGEPSERKSTEEKAKP